MTWCQRFATLAIAAIGCVHAWGSVRAQESSDGPPATASATDVAPTPNVPLMEPSASVSTALADWEAEVDARSGAADPRGPLSESGDPASAKLNLLWLVSRGGPLMAVLGLLSVAVLALAVDRWVALRDTRIMPSPLIATLGELTESDGGLDPGVAYYVCQDYPSPTATILRAMLLKVGRPQAEVDRVAAEAAQREASRLYANARWLTLIAAVAPLIGLLGTVWGLIQAFYETTNLTGDQNRADFLAGGIYEALVTTLGGLVVAIPAAVLAHYFEGKIERAFHRIDELILNLAPHLERFEGRMRVEPNHATARPGGAAERHPGPAVSDTPGSESSPAPRTGGMPQQQSDSDRAIGPTPSPERPIKSRSQR